MGRVLTGYATARFAALVTAGMLVLAGCTGANADPTPSGSAASSGSPTPSSSPTSPSTATATSPSGTATVTLPAAARVHTKEGAIAFARFYYGVLSDSQYRADSSQLRQLSAEGCVACQAFVQKADDMRRRGHHLDSRSLIIDEAFVTPTTIRNGFVVDVLADDRPSRVLTQDGSVVSESQGAKLTFRTHVVWISGGWKVDDSKLVKS